MPRRVSLPAADDLFRRTGEEPAASAPSHVRAVPDAAAEGLKRPSGRVRHDEKMTVYVTADELLEIEHARLTLRSQWGLAVDRGRLVREALSLVLAELGEQGADSALVRRLLED